MRRAPDESDAQDDCPEAGNDPDGLDGLTYGAIIAGIGHAIGTTPDLSAFTPADLAKVHVSTPRHRPAAGGVGFQVPSAGVFSRRPERAKGRLRGTTVLAPPSQWPARVATGCDPP
jgi:hypothetical protein